MCHILCLSAFSLITKLGWPTPHEATNMSSYVYSRTSCQSPLSLLIHPPFLFFSVFPTSPQM